MKLSPRDIQVMKIIADSPNAQAHADEIARRMGYKPARRGRLAVSATLSRLLGEPTHGMYGADGLYVGRIPPQDQWGCAIWFLMPAGRSAVMGRQD